MDCENVYEKIIRELGLEKTKKMAVIYFENLGDFYSLCTASESVARSLDIEVIILYSSEAHGEIIRWFEYGDFPIKSHRLSDEEFSLIRYSEPSIQEKYQDYIISWDYGNKAFRTLTRNNTEDFAKYVKKPRFFSEKIQERYRDYIIPQKTVFIVPESRSVHSFPVWFWNFAAYIFETMGYAVVFNVSPANAKAYNGKCLLVPISDVVKFADECGYIIGVRTGLFDILSSSAAKMTIFSTSHYKPLDRAYGINNSDGRIRTVYYCDDDPVFNKTEPISFVKKAFDREFQPIRELLCRLCTNDIPPFVEEYSANISKAYTCTTMFNKYRVGRPGTDIEPFGSVMYSFDVICGKLVFSIRNLSASDYRFDYKIFCDEKPLIVLGDIRSNCISYPLEQSGEYYIVAIITDLNNYHQEYFETRRVTYTLPQSGVACVVSPAAMLEYTCSAVKSLEKQVEDLKLAHDAANALQIKNDELAAQNLALSDEKNQLEKKLLQAERIAEKQSESFREQRRKLLSELDELRDEINRLNTSAKKSENELKKLRAENKALEERSAIFENSRSWRITKPLRSIGAFYRKIKKGHTDSTIDREE